MESRHPSFKAGDVVLGYDGWQTYAVSNGAGVRTLDPAQAPISTALGVLGMPGMTAYVGLLDIGRPRAGETVVVAAASGAVGSVVGQVAKLKGCRAVGIDVYFEAVLSLVNPGARIPLCGLISQYNATEPARGPDLRPVLVNRVTIRGFIVSDHADRQADFLTDMTRWVREGRLRYREDVVEGLEQAPRAFIGLFEGRNFGKMIVRV